MGPVDIHELDRASLEAAKQIQSWKTEACPGSQCVERCAVRPGGSTAAREDRGSGPLGADNRRFLEAVLWIVRAGACWRDLHPRSGAGTRPGTGGPERLRRLLERGGMGFLQCSMRVRTCGPCVDRMERSQIGHESPGLLARGAEWRQFRKIFQRFQNVLVESGRCAPCILL